MQSFSHILRRYVPLKPPIFFCLLFFLVPQSMLVVYVNVYDLGIGTMMHIWWSNRYKELVGSRLKQATFLWFWFFFFFFLIINKNAYNWSCNALWMMYLVASDNLIGKCRWHNLVLSLFLLLVLEAPDLFVKCLSCDLYLLVLSWDFDFPFSCKGIIVEDYVPRLGKVKCIQWDLKDVMDA